MGEYWYKDNAFDTMFVLSKNTILSGYLIFLQNDDSKQGKQDTQGKDDGIKSFGVGAQILRMLEVESFRLLSSSKGEYTALSGFNLKLIEKIEV